MNEYEREHNRILRHFGAECTVLLKSDGTFPLEAPCELALYGSLYAVRGNNDVWQPGVKDLAGFLRFQIGGVSFYMTHDRWAVPRDLDGVDAVICGHSHCYSEEWIDGRLWLNPGSCGRARFDGDVTMAKLTIRGGKIARVERIDLEDDA